MFSSCVWNPTPVTMPKDTDSKVSTLRTQAFVGLNEEKAARGGTQRTAEPHKDELNLMNTVETHGNAFLMHGNTWWCMANACLPQLEKEVCQQHSSELHWAPTGEASTANHLSATASGEKSCVFTSSSAVWRKYKNHWYLFDLIWASLVLLLICIFPEACINSRST
jgi:hypothetical protein